jgi:hypothetical protein
MRTTHSLAIWLSRECARDNRDNYNCEIHSFAVSNWRITETAPEQCAIVHQVLCFIHSSHREPPQLVSTRPPQLSSQVARVNSPVVSLPSPGSSHRSPILLPFVFAVQAVSVPDAGATTNSGGLIGCGSRQNHRPSLTVRGEADESADDADIQPSQHYTSTCQLGCYRWRTEES